MNLFRIANCFLALALLVGCTGESIDGPGGTTTTTTTPTGPATYAEGVEVLEGLVGKIKAAFDAGTPKDADGPIHEAAVAIKAMPELIKAAGWSEEDATAADDSLKQLLKGLGTLHEAFHHAGEELPSYDDIKGDLEGGLEGLKSKL